MMFTQTPFASPRDSRDVHLRAYTPPRLDILGELREMTRGGCKGIGDAGGSLVTQPPMAGDPTVCFFFAPYHQTP
jgi:hypothetical protein